MVTMDNVIVLKDRRSASKTPVNANVPAGTPTLSPHAQTLIQKLKVIKGEIDKLHAGPLQQAERMTVDALISLVSYNHQIGRQQVETQVAAAFQAPTVNDIARERFQDVVAYLVGYSRGDVVRG